MGLGRKVDILTLLPPAPLDKAGWPWTEVSPVLPPQMPNGQPWPRISIVTPSYQQAEYLEETIRSVLLQRYPNLEYFVIDGGSNDGSREIIERYSQWLSDWISEPDRGQAHAINKGLERATGQIFNWINSDDLLAPGALALIATAFTETNADVLAASCIDFEQGGKEPEEKLITNVNLSLENLLTWKPGTIYHQPAVWLNKRQLQKCGGIQDQYHYVFDWEMMIRYLVKFPRVSYVPHIVARFRLHSSSKTMAKGPAFEAERLQIWALLKYSLPTRKLRKLCGEKLRQLKWLSKLSEMERCPDGLGAYRAARLACLACLDPTIRFTRMTAGAIKRHLLNQYGQFAI